MLIAILFRIDLDLVRRASHPEFNSHTRCCTGLLPGEVLQKKLYGDAQRRLHNIDPSLYLKKPDFVTHLYTIFLEKAPKLRQIGRFLGKIFQNTSNFANWAHWVCDENPPINIPKMTKMHLKTFEHPSIPSQRGGVVALGGPSRAGSVPMPISDIPRRWPGSQAQRKQASAAARQALIGGKACKCSDTSCNNTRNTHMWRSILVRCKPQRRARRLYGVPIT